MAQNISFRALTVKQSKLVEKLFSKLLITMMIKEEITMKKLYETPDVSVCIFDVEDVITTSGMTHETIGQGGETDY